MEGTFNNIKDKIYKVILNDVVILLMAIFSVFLFNFWYLAIPLAIYSLIASIQKIKESGRAISKVAMVFSVLGIVFCAMMYISIFLMLCSELVL